MGPKIQKLSRRGLGLASEMWVGWFLGIGDPIGVGYIGFEEGGLRFGEALGAGSFVCARRHSFVLIPTRLLAPICPACLCVRHSFVLIHTRFCLFLLVPGLPSLSFVSVSST